MRTVLVPIRRLGGVVLAGTLLTAAACGGDDGRSDTEALPSIVVTTNVVGDVVRNLVGSDAEVEVLMPPNANPHDFAPSARQAASLRRADLVVANGLGFEASLVLTLESAAADGVEVIELAELAPRHLGGPSAHEDEDHSDDDGDDGHGHDDDDGHDHDDGDDGHDHDHDGEDPHVFTDPARMAVATARLAEDLAQRVPALDTDAFRTRAAAYVDELERLDAEVEEILAPITPERRILVTNHHVLGYFADRYDFTVLGAVIPALDTLAEPGAADLAQLAGLIRSNDVRAVFVEASSPSRLADALAAEGTDVTVVELFGESLGGPGSGAETYVEMVRTNAERIADALA